MHTNSYDEALGLPSDHTSRVALRTQQIILEESGVADTVDPLGGSYYVESLTSELETRSRRLMEEVDGMGGMIPAIERGFPQREIERAAYEYQKSLESRERHVVGVNVHVEKKASETSVFRIDPELEAEQIAQLGRRRAERERKNVDEHMERLRSCAGSDENLFPHILDAVRAGLTVGEISGALAEVFGRYRDRAGR